MAADSLRTFRPQTVYVKVSTSLLADLAKWSEPLQVKVERQHDDTFEMTFKTPKYDIRTVDDGS